MKKILILLLSFAQFAAAEPNPAEENLDLARHVVQALVDRTAIVDKMTGAIAAQADEISTRAKLSKIEAGQLREAFGEAAKEQLADLFLEEYARVYAAAFTKAELSGILDFFKSDAGKAYLAKKTDLQEEFARCLVSSATEVGRRGALLLEKRFPAVANKIRHIPTLAPNDSSKTAPDVEQRKD